MCFGNFEGIFQNKPANTLWKEIELKIRNPKMKNTFKFYSEDQISDSELINALQWLIKNGIIKVSDSTQTKPSTVQDSKMEGFSAITCKKDDMNIVVMNGKYTNGAIPYKIITLTLGVLGADGKVEATGIENLYDVEPFETRLFYIDSVYKGDYSSCEVQVTTRMESFEN